MHQGKNHGTQRGYPGPAVIYQQSVQGVQICHVHKAPLRKIGHDHYGDHDFVSGQAQKKSQKDHPVQPEELGKGIKKACAMRQ